MGAIRALAVLRRALVLWIGAILWLTLASVAWALCAATLVLFPFGTVGLYVVAHHVAYEQRIEPRVVLALVRAYAPLAVRWAVLNAAVLSGLYGALIYDPVARQLPPALRTLLVVLGAGWLAMQFLFWPLAFEQADKRLLPTLRSASRLVLAAPDFTVVILVVAAFVALLIDSTFPYGLVLAGVLALLAAEAVRDRLAAFGAVPHPDHIHARPNAKHSGDQAGAS